MRDVPKHPEATLSPSEGVTLALRSAINGGGTRACYRWLTRDSLALFPHVPERPRLARLLRTHPVWTARLLAAPTVLGVAATSGIALLHPRRAGRSPQQRGKQGQSHHRWMVGGKRGVGWNPGGLICAWDWATANVHDPHFQPLMAQVDHLMIVLPDPGCHATTGDPAPLTVGQRGPWNPWMRVATVWSMHTTVLPSKQVRQRVWAYCRARVGWTMAAFHLFARWGLEIADENMVRLSIAEFSL